MNSFRLDSSSIYTRIIPPEHTRHTVNDIPEPSKVKEKSRTSTFNTAHQQSDITAYLSKFESAKESKIEPPSVSLTTHEAPAVALAKEKKKEVKEEVREVVAPVPVAPRIESAPPSYSLVREFVQAHFRK